MYNAELYIGKMIESILAQTYASWELIIVDDNSSDKSCDIVRDFASKHKNIRLYIKNEKEKRGANPSRNIGTKLACGEYIVYFDADDLITRYCIDQRVKFMESHEEIDFAIFPAITFRVSPFEYVCNFGYKQEGNVLPHFLSGLLPYTVWTNIYRRSSLIEKDIVWDDDLPCLQDTDFNVLSLYKGLKYKFSNSAPDYLWRFVGNMNSISRSIYTDKRLGTRIELLNKFTSLDFGKHYYNALLLRSFYIYLDVIKSNKPDINNQFFSAEIFLSHKLLLQKLKQHYNIVKKHNISRRLPVLSLLFLFSPSYTFRGLFYNQIRKIRLYVLFLILKKKYKNLVDNNISL